MAGRRYFGTDGIRGVANEPPLDPDSLVRLGRALASVFRTDNRKHRILIGKDTRLSGYMIETSLAAGIMSMGVDVLFTGPIPTPGVAYLTRSMRVDAGVMVSASHNPFEDNGIKIFSPDGLKLADERESEIERRMDLLTISDLIHEPQDIGRASRIDDAVGRYTVFLKSVFPREFTLEGFKVGLDCGNGASYVVSPQALQELGADVSVRGASPNGRNINAGFGSLYPEVVRKLVLDNNLDIGVTLDGDADRIIVVDEEGTVHDGDALLALLALDLKKRGELLGNVVVSTVMSNLGLSKFLERHGIVHERSAVGDRYVLEEMLKRGAVLGGEQSGHLIHLKHSTTGDGTLAALLILSIMSREERPLSELLKGFEKFPQKLINVPVTHKPSIESVPAIHRIIKAKEQELADSGRVLVRYSGTENKLRVMVECEDELDCKRHAEEIADVITRELGSE